MSKKKDETMEVQIVEDKPKSLQVKPIQQDVTQLLQLAIQNGGGLDTVQGLLDMRKQLKEEWAREQFFKSLSLLQAELPTVEKNKAIKNRDGSIRYRYSTLDKIIETIKPYLRKYGFTFYFTTDYDDDAVIVTCNVSHECGHTEKVSFRAPIRYSGNMLPIQEWGAALTYAKRYTLSLAFGIASDEDTDGLGETTFPERFTNNKKPSPQIHVLKNKPKSQKSSELAEIWNSYLAVCDNVKPHAINAIKKIVGDKPKEEWTAEDIQALKEDLERRRKLLMVEEEAEAEVVAEIPEEDMRAPF